VEPNKPQWKRVRFKKNKVWLAVDDTGRALEKDGKVLIKYQTDQPHEYWVRTNNIRPIDVNSMETELPQKATRVDQAGSQKAVCVFTDGASSGNPGPSGIGVVLRFGEHEKEI
jgi:ribonuclease HI